jgi:hypothetical protein
VFSVDIIEYLDDSDNDENDYDDVVDDEEIALFAQEDTLIQALDRTLTPHTHYIEESRTDAIKSNN